MIRIVAIILLSRRRRLALRRSLGLRLGLLSRAGGDARLREEVVVEPVAHASLGGGLGGVLGAEIHQERIRVGAQRRILGLLRDGSVPRAFDRGVLAVG